MTDHKTDGTKRTWIIASGCAGAVGAGFLAVPFVRSFEPSERARAAGAAVEVDISGIKPGEKLTVEWRGKPVWIVRRTAEQIAELPKNDSQLADPQSNFTVFGKVVSGSTTARVRCSRSSASVLLHLARSCFSSRSRRHTKMPSPIT